MIDSALLEAYHDTTYRAFFPGEAADIRIGCRHARLDELLDGKSWAFISACNPASVPASDNPERHAALLLRLEGHVLHPGMGIPDKGNWPPEQSVLVCGINEADAILIGREFGQNAIVCGEQGGIARLVTLS